MSEKTELCKQCESKMTVTGARKKDGFLLTQLVCHVCGRQAMKRVQCPLGLSRRLIKEMAKQGK